MILQIGSIDVSQYVEVGYTVNTEPILASEWTAINGTEHRLMNGVKYSISANLRSIPAATATSIFNAVNAATVSMTFSCPATTTATFVSPSISAELVTEGATASAHGELWDISINATSEPQLNGL